MTEELPPDFGPALHRSSPVPLWAQVEESIGRAILDGRFAVTGPLVAIGGPLQVQRYARRQLTSEEDAAARAWWQEVIGALAR